MTKDKLQVVALKLRNASPETWEEFLTVFEVKTAEVTVAVTQADQSEILRLQGHAQQMISLLRLFKECAVAGT